MIQCSKKLLLEDRGKGGEEGERERGEVG